MQKAEKGNTVKVHYTGTLTDGNMFDSSVEREPLEFTVGAGQMIPGFDAAVEGMQIGEKKQVTIPADKAYGQRVDEAIFNVPKEKLPQELTPEVGMQLQASQPDGRTQLLTISKVMDTEVEVDANHPLAGKDLVFDIELLEVQ